MMKKDIPLYVSIFLAILGITEIVIRCFSIPESHPHPWIIGLIESAHDPGKTLFHVLVMPTAVYLVLRYLQKVDIKAAFSTPLKKFLNSIIIVLLVSVTPIYTYGDIMDGFFDNEVMPWDFKDHLIAEKLLKLRIEGWATIQENIRSQTIPDRKNVLEKYKIEQSRYTETIGSRGFDVYWEYSSVRRKFADLMSFLGALSVCLLIASVALSAGIRNRVESGFTDSLFLSYGVLATWIPMRMYSEWHGSYGTSTSTESLVTATTILLVLAGLFFVFRKPSFKVGITAIGITLVCTIIGAIGTFKHAWFEIIATQFSMVSPLTLITIYVVIFVAFAASVVYMADKEKGTMPKES